MHIKQGDTVRIIAGKDRGREGKVLRVYAKQSKVLIENINMYKKHMQKSEQFPQGGIVEVPRSMHISNVMLIDPKSKEVTRVGISREDKKKKRTSKKSGLEI